MLALIVYWADVTPVCGDVTLLVAVLRQVVNITNLVTQVATLGARITGYDKHWSVDSWLFGVASEAIFLAEVVVFVKIDLLQ